MTLLNNFWSLFLASAPWLLLGLIVAGFLKQWLPQAWIEKQLGGSGTKTTIKAALLGAPLPLCSCGVLPAALSLRRAGASKSATTAFLIATPETGVDSISVSYALLGPLMTVLRPIAAISSAITAGVLVGLQDDKQPKDKPARSSRMTFSADSASCSHHHHHHHHHEHTPQSASSKTAPVPATEKPRLVQELVMALRYAAGPLLGDVAGWLVIGLIFAALVQTAVPADLMAQWGQGLVGMLLMVLVSAPLYICATASTPLAAGLLLSGISPGAALVFMLVGPATNMATLGVVKNELGSRALGGYLVGVTGCALLFGALTDVLVAKFGFEIAAVAGGHYHDVLLFPLLTNVSALILAGLMLRLAWQRYWPRASKLINAAP